MYQEAISFVKTRGQFDVSTMGNVANVGLMAKKAEEYGSHDKTFEIPAHGRVLVKDTNTGEVRDQQLLHQDIPTCDLLMPLRVFTWSAGLL
jgi:isocitrate dehydrogenase